MLKIKDGIDLKELEKFGFQKASSKGVGLFIGHGWGVWDDTNRKITEWHCDPNLDIIFDLINTGLVEKVEDKTFTATKTF